jgi:hypothetical protein
MHDVFSPLVFRRPRDWAANQENETRGKNRTSRLLPDADTSR